MKFKNELSFFPTSRYTVVHCSEVNPCTYTQSTLKGYGLRDDDFVKSFANFIKRKVDAKDESEYSEDALLEDSLGVETPLPVIYNVIHQTTYSHSTLNHLGYAETSSRNIALKIWYLSLAWESLISRKKNTFQACTGLVTHRMTGRKNQSCISIS